MKRFWKDLKGHYKYALYAAKSELKSEVANSYLNWIWWVLEPFCFMLIYSFIFATTGTHTRRSPRAHPAGGIR